MMRAMHLSELCAPLQARLVGEDAEFDAVSVIVPNKFHAPLSEI